MATECDETAHLTARERKARESVKLVLLTASPRPLLATWIVRLLPTGLDRPWSVDQNLPQRSYVNWNVAAQDTGKPNLRLDPGSQRVVRKGGST